MRKSIKKMHIAIMAIIVSLVCAMFYGLSYYQKPLSTSSPLTRTISVSQAEMDYQGIIESFENPNFDYDGSKLSFVGFQTLDASILSSIDNVSQSDVDGFANLQIQYDFSYDNKTNIVTLSAKMINGDLIEIEEIYGSAFINDLGNIDAVLYLDGEYVLLSEMQDAGLVANCGWFSNLFKAVAKAVVVVATCAVCVATAGMGVAAVVAVGAAVGATASVAEQLIDKGTVDLKQVALDTAISAIPFGGGVAVGAKVAAKTAAKEAAEQAAKQATKQGAKAIAKPSGQWKQVNEAMSDASRKYQTQITGRTGEVYVQNGVKFDGVIGDKLVDAKGHYSQFVDKNTGQFYGWFNGKDALKDEAIRQVKAANGVPIQWYFAEKEAMEACQKYFAKEGISGIEFIYKSMI